MKRRVVVGVVSLTLIAAAVWYLGPSPQTPAGQPALVSLTPENFSMFQPEFNRASDDVRLLVLLSPT